MVVAVSSAGRLALLMIGMKNGANTTRKEGGRVKESEVRKYCHECRGKGTIQKSRRNASGDWVYVTVECACVIPVPVTGGIR